MKKRKKVSTNTHKLFIHFLVNWDKGQCFDIGIFLFLFFQYNVSFTWYRWDKIKAPQFREITITLLDCQSASQSNHDTLLFTTIINYNSLQGMYLVDLNIFHKNTWTVNSKIAITVSFTNQCQSIFNNLYESVTFDCYDLVASEACTIKTLQICNVWIL